MAFGANLLKKTSKKTVSKTITVSREHLLDSLLPMLGTLGYTKKKADEVVAVSAKDLPSYITITIQKEYIKGADT